MSDALSPSDRSPDFQKGYTVGYVHAIQEIRRQAQQRVIQTNDWSGYDLLLRICQRVGLDEMFSTMTAR